MMQDSVLRVFVLALSLLLCPRNDPEVEEKWDDSATVDIGKDAGVLQEEEEGHLDNGMSALKEERKLRHGKGPENTEYYQEVNQSELYDTDNRRVRNDEIVFSQDVENDYGEPDLLKRKHGRGDSAPSPAEESKSDSETHLNLDLNTKSKWGEVDRPDITPTETVSSEEHVKRKYELEVSASEESEMSEEVISVSDEDYFWYLWNIFSLFSLIRFTVKYLVKKSLLKHLGQRKSSVTCIAGVVPLHDSDILQRFHSKCVQASLKNKWLGEEFLEGFAHDMVKAMRVTCKGSGGMWIKDYQVITSRNVIIHCAPPEPYGFQCLPWNQQLSDVPPDMQICAQIKVVENKRVCNGCPCQSSGGDEDMVCLLHSEKEKVETEVMDVLDGCLCVENTPFLSKSQVRRWFQSTIKQAWAEVSHKYDFELSIPYIEAPGTLLVRFRSGMKFSFTMNPVVKFTPESHFYMTPCCSNNLDSYWTLSLTMYEDQLLESLSKHLPENPCHIQTLQIACFLHKRQVALSGSSALKECHFKTALLHLLLTKQPSLWKPEAVVCRVRDLLVFMERSLQEKVLHHVVIGNPLTKKMISLPEMFCQAQPVNLFHTLVVHDCIYRNAVMHFQEMLRNTHMLIQDYICVGQL